MVTIGCEIIVDTEEDDRRSEFLHNSVWKYGTLSRTVALAVKRESRIRQASATIGRRLKATEATNWETSFAPILALPQ